MGFRWSAGWAARRAVKRSGPTRSAAARSSRTSIIRPSPQTRDDPAIGDLQAAPSGATRPAHRRRAAPRAITSATPPSSVKAPG